MKVTWKGSISFGLVDIAVELYPAIKPHTLDFDLFHTKCHSPISYQRWCAACNKEVPWEEVEKGIQLKDGSNLVMTPENLKKLRPEKTDEIIIVAFVDEDIIDPILFNKHYYVLPAKPSYQSFFLFAASLDDLDSVAIGQFVMRDKQYVCAIRPYRDVLLLTTLNYAYEIRTLKKMEAIKPPKITKKELALAEQLINKLTEKKFDITKFKDFFVTELIKQISKLKKGTLLPEKKIKAIEKQPKAVSLIKVLEASLTQLKKPKKKAAKITKKRA